jgi:hypothetical protein
MPAKDEIEAAIETVQDTYDELDDSCENVAKNGVMCLDAVVRELKLQRKEGAKESSDVGEDVGERMKDDHERIESDEESGE